MEEEETPEERITRLTQLLMEKEAEAAQLLDRLRRVSAEFENYKRRIAKEKQELRSYAHEELIKELLPVVDNLERAIDHVQTTQSPGGGLGGLSPFIEGVRLTLEQLMKGLERFGAAPFNSTGEPFDPTRHEAMEVVESELFEPNMVIEEHRRGYLFNGRVIRPALVTVSKEPVREEVQEE